jgi:hypothetical protein
MLDIDGDKLRAPKAAGEAQESRAAVSKTADAEPG